MAGVCRSVVFADLLPSLPSFVLHHQWNNPSRSCDYFVSELLGQLCLPKDLYCLDKLLVCAKFRSCQTNQTDFIGLSWFLWLDALVNSRYYPEKEPIYESAVLAWNPSQTWSNSPRTPAILGGHYCLSEAVVGSFKKLPVSYRTRSKASTGNMSC